MKSCFLLFLLVGLSGKIEGSLLMNYPFDDFGLWHRNNFIDFVNWDPFEADDPFEMAFFHNHDLYFPRIRQTRDVSHMAISYPFVKRNDKDVLQLFVDVNGFNPNELSLKLEGRELLIKGMRSGNRNTHNPCFQRRFCWRRTLPDDVDLSSVKATLTKPNTLEIEAKKIKDHESDIQIDVRDSLADQSQPQKDSKRTSRFDHAHGIQRQGNNNYKEDEEATVEIVPDENLD